MYSTLLLKNSIQKYDSFFNLSSNYWFFKKWKWIVWCVVVIIIQKIEEEDEKVKRKKGRDHTNVIQWEGSEFVVDSSTLLL